VRQAPGCVCHAPVWRKVKKKTTEEKKRKNCARCKTYKKKGEKGAIFRGHKKGQAHLAMWEKKGGFTPQTHNKNKQKRGRAAFPVQSDPWEKKGCATEKNVLVNSQGGGKKFGNFKKRVKRKRKERSSAPFRRVELG